MSQNGFMFTLIHSSGKGLENIWPPKLIPLIQCQSWELGNFSYSKVSSLQQGYLLADLYCYTTVCGEDFPEVQLGKRMCRVWFQGSHLC